MRSHFGEGDKLFVNTNFGNGNLSFVNANLGKGLVSFKLAIMGTGKKDFHFCTHTGDMIFERCIMGSGPIDLRAIDFTQGKMSFTRTELGNVELNFDGANFVDYRIIFKYTSFTQGSVIMSNVTAVGCNLSFENLKLRNTDFTLNRSQFARVSLTSSQLDSYIDLRLAQCNYLDLSDSVIRDIVDMIPEGSPVIIQHLNLKGVRLLGKLYADWHLNNIAYLIYNQEHTNYETKAEQFRMLKENYSNIGQYENEDHAYLEFKRCEAKTILNTAPSNTIKTLGNRFLFAFRWLLFDKMGHYATSPVRVLVSMAVAYTLFSFIYILEGMFTGSQIVSSLGDPDHLNIWQRSFYHSAVTFFTIGYGDYYPSGLARFVSALEGFVGLFMMSYFTVAFVRKIIR
jgi:uncharacterized protein YjbI with pentapeptide repeats